MIFLAEELPRRTGKWSEISDHMQQGITADSHATTVLLVGAASLCLLLLFLILMRYYKDLRRRYRPMSLFMQVSKSLGLGLLDRLWLIRVARQQGLISPLVLLMSPATLDHHAERFMASLSSSEARHMARRLQMIRSRLDGQD